MNPENQIKIYHLIEQLQSRLLYHAASNSQIKEIIDDAEVLKNNIQNMHQSVAGKKVAKLFARIKKVGIKVLLDVVDIGYKETIKFCLHGGIYSIQHHL